MNDGCNGCFKEIIGVAFLAGLGTMFILGVLIVDAFKTNRELSTIAASCICAVVLVIGAAFGIKASSRKRML